MDEQQSTLEGLSTAIKMEIDGKEFYLKASEKSTNKAGKELLKNMAAEEDIHRQKFESIYQNIKNKKGWGAVAFQPDGGKNLRSIFARAVEKMATDRKAADSELDAVRIAMSMEVQSYDFYKDRSKKTNLPAEKDFYELVAGEEKGHQLVLLDYYEYLKDPVAYYIKHEHHSLDGG